MSRLGQGGSRQEGVVRAERAGSGGGRSRLGEKTQVFSEKQLTGQESGGESDKCKSHWVLIAKEGKGLERELN